jgi:bifunctional DNA primase/polymerase-like protein/AAA domain-containing protein/primase-like protein
VLPEGKFDLIARYCKIGLAVIPLHPHDYPVIEKDGKLIKKAGKAPLWDDWTKQWTKDENRALQIWKQYPNANVGIVLGEPSGAFVLDFDKDEGGEETRDAFEYKHGYQWTWRTATGGFGTHLWYQMPNFSVASRSQETMQKLGYLGMEIKSTGTQVVAPPSIHPDTKRPYDWDTDSDNLHRELLMDPEPWLLDLLKNGDARREVKQKIERPAEKLAPGGRHNTMVSMAGILRHRIGATPAEIDGFLQVFNRERCDPPYPADHVKQISKSMVKYEPDDPRLVKSISNLYAKVKGSQREEEEFREKYKPITGRQIMEGDYEPLDAVVEDMIYVGLTLLYGPPKIGKSFLTMQIAIAVAKGIPLFGIQPVIRPGRVAYLSIEEKARQTKSKFRTLGVPDADQLLDYIDFYYEMPKLLEGGLEMLEKVIEGSHPSLLIIDSYRAISSNSKNSDIVEREYKHTAKLADLGKSTNTAIVLIHHGSKRGGSQGDNLMEGAAGTHGITAGADCVARLVPDGEGKFLLHGTGREIEEYRFAMERQIKQGFGWVVKASGERAKGTQEREDVLDLLREEGPMKPEIIAKKLGKNNGAVRQLLRSMRSADQLVRNFNGTYVPSEERNEDVSF